MAYPGATGPAGGGEEGGGPDPRAAGPSLPPGRGAGAGGRPTTGSDPRHEPEPGARPVSESLRRHGVHLTPPQSDAVARLLLGRRLVELFSLRNGTLSATFQGAGYAAWRVFITGDGRVLENADASEPDPEGDAEGQLTVVRESDPGARLHLGTLLPRQPGRSLADPGSGCRD